MTYLQVDWSDDEFEDEDETPASVPAPPPPPPAPPAPPPPPPGPPGSGEGTPLISFIFHIHNMPEAFLFTFSLK